MDVEDTRLFPNQFLLGPKAVDGLREWQALRVGEDIHLTAHPGLNTVQVSDAHYSLTLLGFILDPADPAANDKAILQHLLNSFSSINELIDATGTYGGRWIIVATQAQHAVLFTDALGLRQAFFTPQRHAGGIWVGSQPGILAECLGLDMGEAARTFVDTHAFRNHSESRWPTTRTPYKEVRHLLPNHYLDLHAGQDHRYWPQRPLEPVSLEDGVDKLAHLLPALIEAAVMRFDLTLGITAGWDSRLVLAASRNVKDKLGYMTVRQGKMPDTARDIVTPSRLLARLGLQHQVVKAAPYMSGEFSYRFKRNVCFAHDHYGGDAEAILAWSQRRKVALTGSGAEIGRCSFRDQLPDLDRRPVTGADLARLQKMGGLDFALQGFEEWLTGLGEGHGQNVLDLFEWEQGHGNWLAMTQLEFDCAWQDIFTPYNCREVLVTLLSVDERYRRRPDYRLFHATIGRLWPAVLCEPISPQPRPPGRIGRKLRRLFRVGG
ncbi:MAG TPA: hypothetical protein ENI68_08505 [Gammaproteobacteria bacterium]|nr:hypothetical protein [Gammaproteobacteria bacterium]